MLTDDKTTLYNSNISALVKLKQVMHLISDIMIMTISADFTACVYKMTINV